VTQLWPGEKAYFRMLDVGHHERKMGRGAAVHHRHIRKKAILPGNR